MTDFRKKLEEFFDRLGMDSEVPFVNMEEYKRGQCCKACGEPLAKNHSTLEEIGYRDGKGAKS